MADLREDEQDQEMLENSSKPSVASKAEETIQKQSTKPIASHGKDIVIHLTSPANNEDWANLEEREPTSSVRREYVGGTSSVDHKEVHFLEECPSLPLPTSSLPSSPSVSGFFGELFFPSVSSPVSSSLNSSSSSESTPFISLVKSLSAEMESRDGSSSSSSSLKPLLNLVKSISTETSRHEPEVTQSKSDSKLNLHLWRQFTQPRGRDGDSKTAPPSPSAECKVSFFKVPEVEAKLEDTKRKLSEAIQEPLNMLSKMIGDESGGSPKFRPSQRHSNTVAGPESPCVAASGWEQRCSNDAGSSKNARTGLERFRMEMLKAERKETDRQSNAQSSPGGYSKKGKQKKQCLSLAQTSGADDGTTTRYEICSFGDVLQIVETKSSEDHSLCGQEPSSSLASASLTPCSPPKVPSKRLLCFATLAYSYFVFPLPAFLSGLSLGLACGFMIGLLIISLHTPRRSQPALRTNEHIQPDNIIREPRDSEVVKGWMNEICSYDPETYHPSLTFSVFVTLEGTALKLSYPRSNLPRRATFDEGKHDVVFISHRSCELADSKVFLVPPGLAKKRIWNKKYPICIYLCESEAIRSRSSGDRKTKTDTDSEDAEIAPQDLQLRAPREGRENALFLFGRTGREKEEWFRYFLLASRVQSDDRQNHSRGPASNLGSSPSGRWACSDSSSNSDSTEDLPSLFKTKELAGNIKQKILLDYSRYMSKLITSDSCSPLLSPNHSTASSPTDNQMPSSGEPHVSWINALIGRIFWDILREKYWADLVANKIQKKLSKIRLPYFMNELALTELDLGALLPTITHTSSPLVNPRGLWVDLEITYNGALQMTLETKMNLYKLGKEFLPEGVNLADTPTGRSKPRTLVLTDSDEESSSAGSSDEDEVSTAEMQGTAVDKLGSAGVEGCSAGSSTSRKILRFVDKIAKSKYFQKATENEFIKKKIEEVSNTPLLLTVEVQELTGTLVVNIPPPPTDRIWYSFRIPPRLEFKVRPKLGEHEVTFTHVTEWIEKKLQHEFQKVFVMPNMDDIYIPIMHSILDKPGHCKQSPSEVTERASPDNADKY
ncbi:testis-expressed protein 2-like [Amblyraja radiata]|uniref:testis-expressed protein 2-like n=1 Tax=Amblyraja radiata TaxID=386614 RepID=UPI0014025C37|nr:testis-expressed protein 2-like [Amblyraja radiata]